MKCFDLFYLKNYKINLYNQNFEYLFNLFKIRFFNRSSCLGSENKNHFVGYKNCYLLVLSLCSAICLLLPSLRKNLVPLVILCPVYVELGFFMSTYLIIYA